MGGDGRGYRRAILKYAGGCDVPRAAPHRHRRRIVTQVVRDDDIEPLRGLQALLERRVDIPPTSARVQRESGQLQ
jgi:hypothetical protein